MRYVAFLRGINIGSHTVKMEDVSKVFIDLGFSDVKTLIASGNVLFFSEEVREKILKKNIEDALEKVFRFHITVILRTMQEVQKLVSLNPFKKITMEAGMRFQITLFAEEIKQSKYIQEEGFSVIYSERKEVASVVLPHGQTTKLMTFIDKTFGKNSTTRNWNTLEKIAKN